MLDDFKQKIINMHIPTNYRPAQLYNAKGDIKKKWYVEYYCLDPLTNGMKRFKEQFNMNSIHSKQDRLAYGKEMVVFRKSPKCCDA